MSLDARLLEGVARLSVSQDPYQVKFKNKKIGGAIAEALPSFSSDLAKVVEEYCIGPEGDCGLRSEIRKVLYEGSRPQQISKEVLDTYKVWAIHLESCNLVIPAPLGSKEDSKPINAGLFNHIVPNLTGIKKLDIACTQAAMRHFDKLPKLCHLGINTTYLEETYSEEGDGVFEKIAKKQPDLESLSVEDRTLEPAIENLHHFPQLTELTLCGEIAYFVKQNEKLSQHKKLIKLCIKGCERTLERMGPDLFACFPPQLHTLCIDSCRQGHNYKLFARGDFLIAPQTLQTFIFKDGNWIPKLEASDKSEMEKALKAKYPKLQVVFIDSPR